ncbi:MAG: S46 family peptidase [Longimicrobiales bacterium]
MAVSIDQVRGTAVVGGVLFLMACGGGAGPTPPPVPGPRTADPAIETPRTDEAPGQVADPEFDLSRTDTEPGQFVPMVFGVDLDTVRAGRFDQGKMWTFEFPPADYFEEAYGFRPDSSWFARARLGALRIPSCSASFVSAQGLVMTNHHCAREFVSQVSGPGENLLDEGFYAPTLAEERAVEDFEADQLLELVDVTDEVDAALEGVAEEDRSDAREEVLEAIEERIEQERGGEDAGIVVEMVSLYDGGRTSAYVFRRYTRAKLVMAPELQMGFYGGDPDNFTYPRYNLDFAFFRIYDDADRPLAVDHWFPLDDDGLENGDAVFIVGNPGSTSRLQTVAELEYRRDLGDRALLEALRSRMTVLEGYIQDNPDVAEEYDLRNLYFSLSNSEKAYEGQIRGLEDPVILARRQDTQDRFQAAIDADPVMRARYGDLIDRMAAIQVEKAAIADVTRAFAGFGSPALESSTLTRGFWGLQFVAASQQGASEDQIEGLLEGIRGTPRMPAELDAALLAARIRDLREHLGADAESVRNLLQGRSVEDAARAVVEQSALSDSARAVTMAEAGTLGPQDPAVQAVVALLPDFLQLNQVMAAAFPREEAIAAELGRARFEVYGTDVPPDATFSLRIADGTVRGYEYNGTEAPWHTTFYGMYDRHHSFSGRDEWALPARWRTPPSGLDLATPMNFVSTVDIIGGNSGSPVLDRELEVVGVVFDGNMESLPGDYIYLPESNRSVTVDIRAILAALEHAYGATRLVEELRSGAGR